MYVLSMYAWMCILCVCVWGGGGIVRADATNSSRIEKPTRVDIPTPCLSVEPSTFNPTHPNPPLHKPGVI